MALPNGETCKTCVFWSKVEWQRHVDGVKIVQGECRYLPPRVLTTDRIVTRWPLTAEDQWCGQHAKEDAT